MCMGLLLQLIAYFSKFFVNWCLMTVFYHALASLPTKANIDRIYLEHVRDKIWRKWRDKIQKYPRDQVKSKSTQEIRYNPKVPKRSGKIQKYPRDQVQSKHSYENWFNPNWWNTPCVFYTFYTVTQSMSKLFLRIYDEHFTWNLRKRRKTAANQWGNTVTVATCL